MSHKTYIAPKYNTYTIEVCPADHVYVRDTDGQSHAEIASQLLESAKLADLPEDTVVRLVLHRTYQLREKGKHYEDTTTVLETTIGELSG